MKQIFKRLYFVALALSLLSINLFAADGTLDTTFNSPDGFLITPTRLYNRLYIQDDGQILVAGYTRPAPDPEKPFINRLTTTGTPDGSFSPIIPVTFANGEIFDVLVQPFDRKIVAVGYDPTLDNTGPISVIRLLEDGSEDVSFNTNAAAAGVIGIARGVGLDSEGRIIVVGTSATGTVLVARYNTDGTLDTTTTFAANIDGQATSVAIDSSNNIVIVGASTEEEDLFIPVPNSPSNLAGLDFNWIAYRFDATAGTAAPLGGTDITNKVGIANDVVIQPDGQIVIAGYEYTGGTTATSRFRVTRLTSSGLFDTDFTNPTPLNQEFSGAYGLAIQGDGKVVATGFGTDVPPDVALCVVRYNNTGTADATFGTGGLFFLNVFGYTGTSVALQTDGKIVAAGANTARSVPNDAGVVLRLLVDTPPTPLESTTITSPANGSTIETTSVTVSGNAQSPSNVFLHLNGLPVLPGTVTSSPWSLLLTGLTIGTNTIQAFSGYKSGRVNLLSAPITVTVGTTPPVPPCPILPGPASALVTAIRNKYCCRPA